ncbi:hypothetical protein ACQP1G_16375 [Nocardia sp. CA-107356]|uniref:hypothetical protein n=1 Tax=Nocardia sp. CA-107356 TaxID=3239972 RepID=UPI003D8B0205
MAVDFDVEGVPILHYRAEKCVAEEFIANVRRQGLASHITVDDFVTADMRPLPCQQLFLPDHPYQPNASTCEDE